jgi:hypothetical protein
MPSLSGVLAQLRSERDRAEGEIQRLDEAIRILRHLERGGHADGRGNGRPARNRFSAATRARMAAAQRARWAKVKRRQASKPRVMAAARRRMAAAQRARWARHKAEQRKAA